MFLEEKELREYVSVCVRVHVCAYVCGEVFTDRVNVKVWGVFNKKELAGKAGSA